MTNANPITTKRRRYRLLYKLEAMLEPVMFVLAFVWIWLFIIELRAGLTPTQEFVVTAIWVTFILEFLLKLLLAPQWSRYLIKNWLLVIALLIPALRVFRIFKAVRILRLTRVTSTTRIVRAFTSTKRAYGALKDAQGPIPEPEMNIGIMISSSRDIETEQLQEFAQSVGHTIRNELERATKLNWFFHMTESSSLDGNTPRRPSDFLDEASSVMAEGPYDLVIVVTDVPLVSRQQKVVPGLASTTSQIIVLSSRRLVATPRGKTPLNLHSDVVRLNAAALLLHLIGHICGLKHSNNQNSQVMRPFLIKQSRHYLPRFNNQEQRKLAQLAQKLPERELHGSHAAAGFIFHIIMAFRHLPTVLRPLWRNRAPLLPLALPGLATAAVAPSFLLVFTAEIWDVGLGMTNGVAAFYAIISILAATFYLIKAQSLFLPRESNNILTEHLAITNTVIFLSMLFACIGLFIMVGALMMFISLYIFPVGLMETWPTLIQPEITLGDTLRLSAFIATIGVTTGALAGGFESRTVIRHLALFEDEV